MTSPTTRTSQAEVRPVPTNRIRIANDAPVNSDGAYVLYWMISERRLSSSFAVDHAVAMANDLRVPLVIVEPLAVDHLYASDRIHAFVVEGMRDNAHAARRHGVCYLPCVESTKGELTVVLRTLLKRACLLVTNHAPAFFLPKVVASMAKTSRVRVDVVDGVGLLPMVEGGKHFFTAYQFRRVLQKKLPASLQHVPHENPLAALVQKEVSLDASLKARQRFSMEIGEKGFELDALLKSLPISHHVKRVETTTGGTVAARARMHSFVEENLRAYAEERAHPDSNNTSGLSAYLHFGHLSAHEVLRAVVEREHFHIGQMSDRRGAREGAYGLSTSAEAFLDQLVTWRELGAQTATYLDQYDQYESLPEWARRTLDDHRRDPRPTQYTLAQLANGDTGDEVWNAAAHQLRDDGIIHNALRMLWGKKILEWTATPELALQTMIELNDRFALDGRDANSVSGIFWTLGRYDRAFGPERPIFGKIRYMSSTNSKRKWRMKNLLAQSAQTSSTAGAQSSLF